MKARKKGGQAGGVEELEGAEGRRVHALSHKGVYPLGNCEQLILHIGNPQR